MMGLKTLNSDLPTSYLWVGKKQTKDKLPIEVLKSCSVYLLGGFLGPIKRKVIIYKTYNEVSLVEQNTIEYVSWPISNSLLFF